MLLSIVLQMYSQKRSELDPFIVFSDSGNLGYGSLSGRIVPLSAVEGHPTPQPFEKEIAMPRLPKADDLATIEARREALRAELAALDERAKALELASRDAGRSILIAALDRIKIAPMEKANAKAIATAISVHGGKSRGRAYRVLAGALISSFRGFSRAPVRLRDDASRR